MANVLVVLLVLTGFIVGIDYSATGGETVHAAIAFASGL